MTDVVREPGEIVPLCGVTLDVFVADAKDVTIGDNSHEAWQDRIVSMTTTSNGLVCYRLALVAGDRLRVRNGESYVALVRELAEVYTVESDQVELVALVQKARALVERA